MSEILTIIASREFIERDVQSVVDSPAKLQVLAKMMKKLQRTQQRRARLTRTFHEIRLRFRQTFSHK